MRTRAWLVCLALAMAGPALGAEKEAKGKLFPDVPILGGTMSVTYYLPSCYDPKIPPPVLYCQADSNRNQDMASLLEPAAEKLGWIVVTCPILSNNLTPATQRDLDSILAACDKLFTAHPQERFALGAFGGCRLMYDLALRKKGGLAGVILWYGYARNPTEYPAPSTAVWLATNRGSWSAMGDLYVRLVGLGRDANLSVDRERNARLTSDSLVPAGRWLMRRYLGRGGKLLPAEKERVEKFVESELTEAKKLRDGGSLGDSFLIVDDLRNYGGPQKDAIAVLRRELLSDQRIRKEQEALTIYGKILALAVPTKKNETVMSRLATVMPNLNRLVDEYPGTVGGKKADDLAEVLRQGW